MKKLLSLGLGRSVIIFTYLVVILSSYLATPMEISTQELGERLHTDWMIIDYQVTPATPRLNDKVKLQARIGIVSIIEPLPQVVEVMLKIDGVQYSLSSLVFERDPTQTMTVQVYWTATAGKHRFEWIVDPFSKYDDPVLENNYAAFDLEVTPIRETTTIISTVFETTTATQTELVTVSTTYFETRHTTVTEVTEVLKIETTSVTVKEVETTTKIGTTTKYHTLTTTTEITQVITSLIGELAKVPGYVLAGIGGLAGAIVVLVGILGLIIGRKTSPKPEKIIDRIMGRVNDEIIVCVKRLRLAKETDEPMEARPGDYYKDKSVIVSIRDDGNVAIVIDYTTIYSSEIEERPLSLEDLSKIDRELLSELVGLMKHTNQPEVQERLKLNDTQKEIIKILIREMEKELMIKKTIT